MWGAIPGFAAGKFGKWGIKVAERAAKTRGKFKDYYPKGLLGKAGKWVGDKANTVDNWWNADKYAAEAAARARQREINRANAEFYWSTHGKGRHNPNSPNYNPEARSDWRRFSKGGLIR